MGGGRGGGRKEGQASDIPQTLSLSLAELQLIEKDRHLSSLKTDSCVV